MEKIYKSSLNDLALISSTVGKFPEYVQGGGGNTSIKFNDELMAVKASGFKLKQVTENEGYVVINYKNIKEYYKNTELDSDIDYEKNSIQFAIDNVVPCGGITKLRPSVEAGFHSILKKYVIHTHSVYSNILCCSEEGKEMSKKIFPSDEWNIAWVPYVNPGFYLTLEIIKAIKRYKDKDGNSPEIFFMENHGLVTTSEDKDHCIQLHNKVNNRIKDYLKIYKDYPNIVLKDYQDKEKVDTYISGTKYLKDYFNGNKISRDYFERVVLYPDQLVYLVGGISIDGEDRNKLNINTKTGDILYHTNYQEAMTMEEILLACVYIISEIESHGFNVRPISKSKADYILNWESEKYRRTLA